MNGVVPYTDRYHELHAPRADSDASSGNQNKSLGAFEGLMKRMKNQGPLYDQDFAAQCRTWRYH